MGMNLGHWLVGSGEKSLVNHFLSSAALDCRSAALRGSLRREEGIFRAITAGLKACSTPFHMTIWSLRGHFGSIFCLT
jgi:hypothetical protein